MGPQPERASKRPAAGPHPYDRLPPGYDSKRIKPQAPQGSSDRRDPAIPEVPPRQRKEPEVIPQPNPLELKGAPKKAAEPPLPAKIKSESEKKGE